MSNEKERTNNAANYNLSDGTLLAGREVPSSGKSLIEPRSNPIEESNRKTAVGIIKENAIDIKNAAKKYNVTPEAIATAIAWEGAENSAFRAGTPGRVHSNTARSIYNIDKRIPRDYTPDRIGEPKVAIEYIGAIMRDNANVYKNNSGIDISKNTPLLADLYQNGSAARLGKIIAEKREGDRQAGRPLSDPRVAKGNYMGEYAKNGVNSTVIMQWLGTLKEHYGPRGMNQSPNNSSDPPTVQADNGSATEQAESSEKPVLIARGGVPTLTARGSEPVPTLQARGGNETDRQQGLTLTQ